MNLIPHFTVAESVFLGQEYRTRWGALDRRRMKAATAQFFQQNWQLAIDPERLVRDLSLAERKLVQIARALIDGAARLVVFDEPTAPLEAQEASLVSSAILRLRDQGIAILYISHYLNEIATLCDRGTVLRNGEVVGYPDRDLLQNTEALIAMMVGREIDQLYTPRQRPAADNGATPLLSVRQLSDGRQLQDLSFAGRRTRCAGRLTLRLTSGGTRHHPPRGPAAAHSYAKAGDPRRHGAGAARPPPSGADPALHHRRQY